MKNGCPANILIADQHMDCQGPLREKRFGNPAFVAHDGKPWDGIHMRGRLAIRHFTNSFIRILSELSPPARNYPSQDFHRSCPQTQHQSRQPDNYGQDKFGQPGKYEYQYQCGSHGYNTNSKHHYRQNRTQTDSTGYHRQFNTQNYGYNVGVSNRFNNLGFY